MNNAVDLTGHLWATLGTFSEAAYGGAGAQDARRARSEAKGWQTLPNDLPVSHGSYSASEFTWLNAEAFVARYGDTAVTAGDFLVA